MLLQLASYSQEPAHLLDAINTLGSCLAENYRTVKTSSQMRDLVILEMLKNAKSSPEAWRAKYELQYAGLENIDIKPNA